MINWTSGSTLKLSAAGNIDINAAIIAQWGGLTLSPGTTGTISASATINVGTFTQTAGTFLADQWLPAGVHGGRLPHHRRHLFIRATGGDGSSATPYIISDVYGLQGIGSAGMLGKSFVLANDIDASGTSSWNSGAGFVPIGDSTSTYRGNFDGQGHVISGLTIDRPGTNFVGLFGYIGGGSTVTDVGLEGGAITGHTAVGALAGGMPGPSKRPTPAAL